VHTAAYWADGGYRELDAPTLDAHYAVNVRGAMLLSVAFARRWPGGSGGRIISIASGQSQGPMPGELVFIATERVDTAFSPSLSTARLLRWGLGSTPSISAR